LKRKTKGWCFVFSVADTKRLVSLLWNLVPQCMRYKLGITSNPVSTDPEMEK